MAGALRVILDTNVIFSGIGWERGVAHQILRAVVNQQVQLVLSSFIIEEAREKVRTKIKHPRKQEELEAFFKAARYELVPDPPVEAIKQHLDLIPDDPDDVPIALLAIRENVDVLVTGNTKHFFKNASSELHEQAQVMTPRQFIDTFLDNRRDK